MAWNCVLRLSLVLWVVRVPLAFTLLGLALLGLAPQAQDLFVEFDDPSWVVEVSNQLLLAAVLMLVWAMPTHYAGRLLLDTDSRLQSQLGCNAEDRDAERVAKVFKASVVYVPRVLGLLTFVAVLIAIRRSSNNLPVLDEQDTVIAPVRHSLLIMAALVVAAAVLFGFYVAYRPKHADELVPRRLRSANAWITPRLRRISPGLADAPGSRDEANRGVGRSILFAIFLVFLFIFAFGADAAGHLFPRAMAVPFILGGWLPFLSWLAGFGRQFRAPLIGGFALLIMLVALIIGDNHTVRLINAETTVGHGVDLSPLPIDRAARMWMQENHCDAPGATCPRPIIIAAAGGASRAGFFTASVVGYFMQRAADTHEIDPEELRKRMFAISGVSGGAVGAVMLAAALDASADGRTQPCLEQPESLWWGYTVTNWRDCFEAIASGDFLSSDFFGFAFNDMFPFGPWRDRAAVLEDTWSRRYDKVMKPGYAADPARKCTGLTCPFLTLRPRDGHWVPLLVLNGTSEATGQRIITTALASAYPLKLNPEATCPTAPGIEPCPLFTDAARFHDMLADPRQSGRLRDAFARHVFGVVEKDGDDVRLSTAAHNSARFPFISPPGSIRSRSGGIVDRIVDGGYFENYGALSAKEIALALHAVQPGLSPLVIVISNDPDDAFTADDSAASAATTPAASTPKPASIDSSEFFSEVTTPLTTISNARSAHGVLAVDELHSAVRGATGCATNLIDIRVWPQRQGDSGRSKAVSMSWWLSKPVQRHLHQQTEGTKNGNQNSEHLDAVWTALKTPPDCPPPSQ